METTMNCPNFFKNYFLEEERPFSSKRDFKFNRIIVSGCSVLVLVVIGILCIPNSQTPTEVFNVKQSAGRSLDREGVEAGTEDVMKQMEEARLNAHSVHDSLNYLYSSPRRGGSSNRGGSQDRSASMIIPRNGDAKSRLSNGTRVQVRLAENVVVSTQSVPIVGYVSSNVYHDSVLAIPKGAKLLGETSFNESTERASVNWRSIIMSNGSELAFSALTMGSDSREGIEGHVRSEAIKNSIGLTLSRFVGAYAEGSINTGILGANAGGHRNGIRNAIAATATDRANALGQDLQKERKWIELSRGSVITAILTQPFVFRDPGGR